VGLSPENTVDIFPTAHPRAKESHVLLILGRNLVEAAEAQGGHVTEDLQYVAPVKRAGAPLQLQTTRSDRFLERASKQCL
jgi:hypothetical protein